MGFHQRPTDGAAHEEWHLHAHFLSAAAAVGDGAQVSGGVRNAGHAAARHHRRSGGGAAARGVAMPQPIRGETRRPTLIYFLSICASNSFTATSSCESLPVYDSPIGRLTATSTGRGLFSMTLPSAPG